MNRLSWTMNISYYKKKLVNYAIAFLTPIL